MFTRGLAICLTLAVASVAQAGAVLTLERTGTGDILVGSSEIINLHLTQTDGVTTPPMLVRMIQLDMSASDAGLSFAAPGTSGTIVEMWDYASATDCPGTCGDAHLIDADFTDSVVSTAFGDASHLDPDDMFQMNLGDGVQVKIGEIVVTCEAVGSQTMDALNAADTDLDAGAKVMFGFGVNIDGTPITVWTAYDADVTGNTLVLPCIPDVTDVNLVPPADPICDASLTRSHDNCMLFTFDGAIAAPNAGDITIRELDTGGGYIGLDLSDQFTFTVEPGDILKIAENGDVLDNGTWYGIVNSGWSGVTAFKVDYRVVYGDVDNNGSTTAADASDVWGNRGPAAGDCDPYDVDGNGSITASDASDTWGLRGSVAPAKPAGHACSP